ncbi:hypothetical protein KY310_01095 [Candidatus Woesearchaeota archaeon]|nr:hypothetical protein [Candidatus Woesearchaeota archaeon]
MKITIDTSQDSHNDIRKAIRMLQSIVGEGPVYSNSPSRNIFDDPSPGLGASEPEPVAEQDTGNAFASIFDNSAPASETEEKKEEDEDIPEIQFY